MTLSRTICSASILGLLSTLNSATLQAGTMGPITTPATNHIYFGAFGGGGSSNHANLSQYGTAFFSEAEGGPLAVNGFGHTNRRQAGMVGGHIGYQWQNILLNAFSHQASVSPVVELEGFYLEKSAFTGHEVSNDTARLPEHDFLATYPTSTGVFLANALLSLNATDNAKWHPYVSGGIGAAVLSVSNANALQLAPLEANINHYNSNPNDKTSTFAAQTKVGLNFDISERVSLFAEYRGLYIADTTLTFGSTVVPTHAATSSWSVHLGSQYYNVGAAGIHFII